MYIQSLSYIQANPQTCDIQNRYALSTFTETPNEAATACSCFCSQQIVLKQYRIFKVVVKFGEVDEFLFKLLRQEEESTGQKARLVLSVVDHQ